MIIIKNNIIKSLFTLQLQALGSKNIDKKEFRITLCLTWLIREFKSHQLNRKPTRSINFLNIILTIMHETTTFSIQFNYFDQEVFDNIKAINSIKSKIYRLTLNKKKRLITKTQFNLHLTSRSNKNFIKIRNWWSKLKFYKGGLWARKYLNSFTDITVPSLKSK